MSAQGAEPVWSCWKVKSCQVWMPSAVLKMEDARGSVQAAPEKLSVSLPQLLPTVATVTQMTNPPLSTVIKRKALTPLPPSTLPTCASSTTSCCACSETGSVSDRTSSSCASSLLRLSVRRSYGP
uniref:Uncharacterized protein n=1 Tax=Anguilla anguilla TaxID=7936 RepID=A0A0E9WT10_ANGAN